MLQCRASEQNVLDVKAQKPRQDGSDSQQQGINHVNDHFGRHVSSQNVHDENVRHGQIEQTRPVGIQPFPSVFANLLPKGFVKDMKEQSHSIPASQHEEREHENKVTVIVVPNALIHPNAMMIELQDASVADTAMMTAWRAYDVTLFTKGGFG